MKLRGLEVAGKAVTSPPQKSGSETTLRTSPRFSAVRSHEDDQQLPPDYSKRKVTLDDAEDEDSGSGEDLKLNQRLTIPAKGIRTYADGKPKPRFRGVVHGAVTALLAFIVPALVAALLLGKLAPRWWAMVGFLLGKGASYFASAFLHLYPFATVGGVTAALKLDLMAVPLSIWGGTPAPEAELLTYAWFVHLGVGAAVTGVNGAMVYMQFVGHVGLETPKGRSDAPRTALVVAQFVWAFWHIGWHYGYQDLWFASLFVYAAAFACSVPVTHGHAQEVGLFGLAPWHAVQVWGLHEDFHALLLVADLCMAAVGARFLLNPPLDSHPTFVFQ